MATKKATSRNKPRKAPEVPVESAKVAELEPPAELNEETQVFAQFQKEDAIPIAEAVYQVWQSWCDFELTVLQPIFPQFDPPLIHRPELITNTTEHEFVYPIHDYGYRFLTSKQHDMFASGKSMCKLYYTIEKIIAILIARLESEGIAPETEVQVAFGGHELSQRKGFEIIINLKNNMVVTNFDPGAWGERYLKIVKNLSNLGYGYPSETPRDIYKRRYHSDGTIKPK